MFFVFIPIYSNNFKIFIKHDILKNLNPYKIFTNY